MNKAALNELGNFTGTQQYHRLRPFTMVASDGAIFLAQNADAFWMLQEIAGAQDERAIKNDPSLNGIQFWALEKVDGDANRPQAKLVCYRDEGDPAWSKEIPFTDFPFDVCPNPRVWVAPTELEGREVQVAYLPSEH